jgi:hypothetical protein
MTFRFAWREALRRFWKGDGSTDGAVPSKLLFSAALRVLCFLCFLCVEISLPFNCMNYGSE